MSSPAAGRKLLPPGVLARRAIALSVSDSDDLSVLGLLPMHLQLALAELARVVFVSDGRLLYGGDLRAKGHTEFLLQELTQYGRGQGALELYLAWSVHRRTPIASLEDTDRRLGVSGRLVALDNAGQDLADFHADRPPAGVDDLSATDKERAYRAMRERVRTEEYARLAIGGQRRRGDAALGQLDLLPGVLEEVLLSIEAQHPVYLAGGFGGMTGDIAVALDPHCQALRAPRAGPIGPRAQAALADLSGRNGWALLNNDLDDDENRRLAATHRPSEIAALVATGLGRRIQRGV